jgi:hypothetical protein
MSLEGSFGMILERDWLKFNQNLELLFNFVMSLESVFHELDIKFHYNLKSNLEDLAY